MVAICAFLIILVILFGIESVRSFIFGTFGIIAWVVLAVLALGAIISIGEWFHKELEKDKKRKKDKLPKWVVILYGSFAAIFLILILALIIANAQ